MPYKHCSEEFDVSFKKTQGLKWLPWVGTSFAHRPPENRLLIVGESHYYQNDEKLSNQQKAEYTRAVVSEALITQLWSTRTLDTLPRLLFGTDKLDRARFWGDTAYYVFVQRGMNTIKERPSIKDFTSGWGTFLDVARTVMPSHCLFIGVEAFNQFNEVMAHSSVQHEKVQRADKISGAYARHASVVLDNHRLSLIGVQHLGARCSWHQWRNYLLRKHKDLTDFLEAGQYTDSTKAQHGDTE